MDKWKMDKSTDTAERQSGVGSDPGSSIGQCCDL